MKHIYAEHIYQFIPTGWTCPRGSKQVKWTDLRLLAVLVELSERIYLTSILIPGKWFPACSCHKNSSRRVVICSGSLIIFLGICQRHRAKFSHFFMTTSLHLRGWIREGWERVATHKEANSTTSDRTRMGSNEC